MMTETMESLAEQSRILEQEKRAYERFNALRHQMLLREMRGALIGSLGTALLGGALCWAIKSNGEDVVKPKTVVPTQQISTVKPGMR